MNIQIYHGQAARILLHENVPYVCVQNDKGAWIAISQLGQIAGASMMTSAELPDYRRQARNIVHNNGALADPTPAKASPEPKPSNGEWQPEFTQSTPTI